MFADAMLAHIKGDAALLAMLAEAGCGHVTAADVRGWTAAQKAAAMLWAASVWIGSEGVRVPRVERPGFVPTGGANGCE